MAPISLPPLKNMLFRALIKAFAVKHRLRLAVLGSLRPFSVHDLLLFSSLICPDLFSLSAVDDATEISDFETVHGYEWYPHLGRQVGKVPAFQSPPSAVPRPGPFVLLKTAKPTPLQVPASLESCPVPSNLRLANSPPDKAGAIVPAVAEAIAVASPAQDATLQAPAAPPPGNKPTTTPPSTTRQRASPNQLPSVYSTPRRQRSTQHLHLQAQATGGSINLESGRDWAPLLRLGSVLHPQCELRSPVAFIGPGSLLRRYVPRSSPRPGQTFSSLCRTGSRIILDFHSATAEQTTSKNYYRPLTPQQVGLFSLFPTRQSLHPCSSTYSPGASRRQTTLKGWPGNFLLATGGGPVAG